MFIKLCDYKISMCSLCAVYRIKSKITELWLNKEKYRNVGIICVNYHVDFSAFTSNYKLMLCIFITTDGATNNQQFVIHFL